MEPQSHMPHIRTIPAYKIVTLAHNLCISFYSILFVRLYCTGFWDCNMYVRDNIRDTSIAAMSKYADHEPIV